VTREECVKFARYIGELCPQQAIGRATGLAWHDVIGHLDAAECRRAAALVAGRQPWVSPADIIAEVAAERCAQEPHSEACRGGNCRDCKYGGRWCMCVCHPRAIADLAGPKPPPAPALPAGPRRYNPAELTIGRNVE